MRKGKIGIRKKTEKLFANCGFETSIGKTTCNTKKLHSINDYLLIFKHSRQIAGIAAKE